MNNTTKVSWDVMLWVRVTSSGISNDCTAIILIYFLGCLTLEDEGDMILSNAGNLSLNDAASHPETSESLAALLLRT
jgi:hypothetical protein